MKQLLIMIISFLVLAGCQHETGTDTASTDTTTDTTAPTDTTTADTTTDTIAPANPVTVAALPIPDGVEVYAVSGTAAKLNWNMVSDLSASGYIIYRDGLEIAQVTSTSFDDIGLSPKTYSDPLYCYTVATYDNAGNVSEQSAAACASSNIVSYEYDVDGCLLTHNAEDSIDYINSNFLGKTLVWNTADYTTDWDYHASGKQIAVFFYDDTGTGCYKRGYHDYILIKDAITAEPFKTPDMIAYSADISIEVGTPEVTADGTSYPYTMTVTNTSGIPIAGLGYRLDVSGIARGPFAAGESQTANSIIFVPTGEAGQINVTVELWDGTVLNSATVDL